MVQHIFFSVKVLINAFEIWLGDWMGIQPVKKFAPAFPKGST